MPDRLVRYVFRRLHLGRLTEPVTSRINGHRGKFLMLFAFIYLMIGYGYLVVMTAGRLATFGWLPTWLMGILAWPWLISAGVAILSAWKCTPPRTDRFGFMAIAVVPMLWGCLFLISWILNYSQTGWLSSVTYFALASIVVLVSSWPNAVEVTPMFRVLPHPLDGDE